MAQIVVTTILSLGFGIFLGLSAGSAALMGGSINVVANFYFARKLYSGRQAGGMKSIHIVPSLSQIMLRFYVGEVVKLFITITLLALAIGVLKLSFIPLFSTFIATLLAFLLAPIFINYLFGARS